MFSPVIYLMLHSLFLHCGCQEAGAPSRVR